MAKEIERYGIPVVVITALPELASALGVSRIVQGVRIEHVCGDPTLSDEADAVVQLRLVEAALKALETSVDCPTVFEAAQGESG